MPTLKPVVFARTSTRICELESWSCGGSHPGHVPKGGCLSSDTVHYSISSNKTPLELAATCVLLSRCRWNILLSCKSQTWPMAISRMSTSTSTSDYSQLIVSSHASFQWGASCLTRASISVRTLPSITYLSILQRRFIVYSEHERSLSDHTYD
jgi:hypothetical protein